MFTLFYSTTTSTTDIYTLSLHDALPISRIHAPVDGRPVIGEDDDAVCTARSDAEGVGEARIAGADVRVDTLRRAGRREVERAARSEEHTSELQSLAYLVCRLLLEKKK